MFTDLRAAGGVGTLRLDQIHGVPSMGELLANSTASYEHHSLDEPAIL